MSKNCTNCGAEATAEARFCRMCGDSFEAPTTVENGASVLTATSPIGSRARPTDQLDPNETSRSLPNTSPVIPAETDDLRGRAHTEEQLTADATTHYATIRSLSGAAEQDVKQTTALTNAPVSVPDTEVTLARNNESEKFATTMLDAPIAAPVATTVGGVTTVAAVPTVLPSTARRRSRGRWWAIAAVLLCGVVAGSVWWYMVTKPSTAGNKQQLARARLVEAETLLASGNAQAAITLVREAIGYDNANADARRLLGDALLQQGKRREAIEEYQAATQLDLNNVAAWSALAKAQLDEGYYTEAVESYRRLIAVARSEADINDHVRLAYADALRLSGRTAEAQTLYRGLARSASVDVASSATKHLVNYSDPRGNANVSVASSKRTEASAGGVAPGGSPTSDVATALDSEHYARGANPMSSAALAKLRSAAKTDPDASYYLGLSIVRNRKLRSLKRAELLDALLHFQKAQKGRFSQQAREYEGRLGREYDRRRGQ